MSTGDDAITAGHIGFFSAAFDHTSLGSTLGTFVENEPSRYHNEGSLFTLATLTADSI